MVRKLDHLPCLLNVKDSPYIWTKPAWVNEAVLGLDYLLLHFVVIDFAIQRKFEIADDRGPVNHDFIIIHFLLVHLLIVDCNDAVIPDELVDFCLWLTISSALAASDKRVYLNPLILAVTPKQGQVCH